jgi:hypothetical protein
MKRETVAALILFCRRRLRRRRRRRGGLHACRRTTLPRAARRDDPARGGVAKGASEAVRLRLPSSAVTVLFAADADAASALALDDGVVRGDRSQVGNVVLAWEAVPDPDDELAVEACIT